MNEKDDFPKREVERLSSSVERMRDATKKLTEVITRAREETSQSNKLAERAIRVATDVEKSASVRVDRLTQEFTGVKRAVQDSIDEIKQRLERKGIPGVNMTPDTVSSGSADRLIAKRLNDLEIRVGNNEATSNRQCEAQRDVIAEVRGEMTEVKSKLGSLRESSRSQARSRSSSAEPGAWKESVAGLRRNIEEVSNLSSKTREDAKRATEQQERSSAEIESLRMEVKEIRENAAMQAAGHADKIKSYATLIADQKRETERLNVRIGALAGLLEESLPRPCRRRHREICRTLVRESLRIGTTSIC